MRARYRVSATLLALSACGPAPEPATPPSTPPATAEIGSATPGGYLPPTRDPARGPKGERAEIAGTRVKIIHPSGPEELVLPDEIHPPPGDPSLLGIAPTTLLYLDDGTLVIGAADGTVTLRAEGGKRRVSVGLRGAITGLTLAGEGLFAATTDHGVLAMITSRGVLRWEKQLTAEPFGRPVVVPGRMILAASQRGVFAVSLTGEVVFSHASRLLFKDTCDRWGHGCKEWTPTLALDGERVTTAEGVSFRLDDPHPPVPSLTPTFPLRFHRVLPGKVIATLAGKPGELWALSRRPPKKDAWADDLVPRWKPTYGDEFTEDRYDLVHLEGEKITRYAVPHEASKEEVFVPGTRAAKGPFHLDGLVPGPDGAPWILARRINWERTGGESGYAGRLRGPGQILALDLQRSSVRERGDLLKAFLGHWTFTPIAAAPEGPLRLLCVGAEQPMCAAPAGAGLRAIVPPTTIVAMRRIGGREWMVGEQGQIFRGEGFERVAGPEGVKVTAVAGTSDHDVWADAGQRYFAHHHDGSRWTDVPVPSERTAGFVVRAADDVWSGDGQARWDGQRWSRIGGAPRASSVTAVGPDQVWMGGEYLHVGTAPGPAPVELAPAAVAGEVGEIVTLSLEAAEPSLIIERSRLPVSGSVPLTAARAVSASADGVLWFQTWDRLVELDGDKATVLQRPGRESFGRWAQPVSKGSGYVIGEDGLFHLDGRSSTAEDVELDDHDLSGLHGDVGSRRGAIWLVGAPTPSQISRYPRELSPHALVRTADSGFRPVLGLPSAAWTAVAATPDGGAFFAGGRSPGPAGEGILFHARGRLGSAGSRRFRAPSSLLSVSAAGADEAWAAGAAGTIIHVRGGAARRFKLPSGEWLRAVLVTRPDDVWIAGDGGTLIHHDGRAFHLVSHGLGANASFTGLAAARGAVWAVSPTGILRITRRG